MTKLIPTEQLIQHVEEQLRECQAKGDFYGIFYKRRLLNNLKKQMS